MGKKPVVVFVGLIWAGMALVGCENCSNCRNKFSKPPAFSTKNAPKADDKLGDDAPKATPVAAEGAKAETTAKMPEAVGTKGFSSTTSSSTPTPLATSSGRTSPTNVNSSTQSNLQPVDSTAGTSTLPGRTDMDRDSMPVATSTHVPPSPTLQRPATTNSLRPVSASSTNPDIRELPSISPDAERSVPVQPTAATNSMLPPPPANPSSNNSMPLAPAAAPTSGTSEPTLPNLH